jgi:hypothetical protein
MVENYPESIQLIAKFTVQSLQVCVETFNLLILKYFAAMYAKISIPLYEIVQVGPPPPGEGNGGVVGCGW